MGDSTVEDRDDAVVVVLLRRAIEQSAVVLHEQFRQFRERPARATVFGVFGVFGCSEMTGMGVAFKSNRPAPSFLGRPIGCVTEELPDWALSTLLNLVATSAGSRARGAMAPVEACNGGGRSGRGGFAVACSGARPRPGDAGERARRRGVGMPVRVRVVQIRSQLRARSNQIHQVVDLPFHIRSLDAQAAAIEARPCQSRDQCAHRNCERRPPNAQPSNDSRRRWLVLCLRLRENARTTRIGYRRVASQLREIAAAGRGGAIHGRLPEFAMNPRIKGAGVPSRGVSPENNPFRRAAAGKRRSEQTPHTAPWRPRG